MPEFSFELIMNSKGSKDFLGYFYCQKYPSCAWIGLDVFLLVKVIGYSME
jgi:hypothetical protein